MTDRRTGSDGVTSFLIVEGTHSVEVCEDNCIVLDSLVVSSDITTQATASFGLLRVTVTGVDGVSLNADVILYEESGIYVTDRRTGSDGVTSFSLAEGRYSVDVCEDNCISVEYLQLRTLESTAIEIQLTKSQNSATEMLRET